MTITLVPTSQSVTVTMTQVQYDLLAAGITDHQPLFEQLLMSYCQQVQRAQEDRERSQLTTFAETAAPAQRAALLASMTALQTETA